MSDLPTPNQPHPPKRLATMTSNQPANHLLNFTLPPRQPRPLSSIPRRSRKTSNMHGVWNSERYVNAQYRFVVSPSGDYTVHFADPDIFFQWSDILQVIIPRSSMLASTATTRDQSLQAQDGGQTSCPICLSPPTAPRMTKCGHIFCFHCVLHYLGTSENKWARCPICFDSVNERQLKSVKWFDWEGSGAYNFNESLPEPSSSVVGGDFESLRPGSLLRMRLIERPKITTLALPRSHTWPSDLLPPHQAPFHFLPDVYQFSKFMLATPTYLVSDLTQDLKELASERRLLLDMKDDLGISFIDGAEAKVRQQIARATTLDTPILTDQIERVLKDQHDLEELVAYRQSNKGKQSFQEEIPTDFLAAKSSETRTQSATLPSESSEVSNSRKSLTRSQTSQSRNHPRQRRNINPPPPNSQTYHYYQAASGLPIYLHPLDIRILLAHFGSYSAFPDAVTVQVEAFSESSIDDDLRKRCKYLAHMPEGADVVFVETNLEGVVSAEVLKNFEWLLKSRTSRRKEKGKKEDRAKTKAEEREREKEKLWTSSAAQSLSHSNPTSIRSPQSVDDFSTFAASTPQEVESPEPLPPETSGAWGARSFASALHSPPTNASGQGQQRNGASAEDDWDIDAVWHELEQRTGGRKKKGAKLVMLGGGGSGGGRRR